MIGTKDAIFFLGFWPRNKIEVKGQSLIAMLMVKINYHIISK